MAVTVGGMMTKRWVKGEGSVYRPKDGRLVGHLTYAPILNGAYVTGNTSCSATELPARRYGRFSRRDALSAGSGAAP
jgi:hypothetical protein